MTLSCHDYGNPTLDKCRFCNDRAACEEEFQTRFTKEEAPAAPLINFDEVMHNPKFEKAITLIAGILIGAAGVVIMQSSFGIPMAVVVMAAVFGAGYMVGGDSKKKKPAASRVAPMKRRRYG